MQHHPIVLLVQKIESYHSKDIQKHLSASKKQRSKKLYNLIIHARNEGQLERTLLFKKLFGKVYSEKNDYLWRNEIRLLKEELEIFLVQKEHEFISKNNDAYNQWLLIQAYDKMKYLNGITEHYEHLVREKHEFASYAYTFDAHSIMLQNLQHTIPDIAKRIEAYPSYIEEFTETLKDNFAASCARINLPIGQFNWLSFIHNNDMVIPPLEAYFTGNLNENHLSIFYNNYGKTYYPDLDLKMDGFNKAINAIEIIAQKNKLLIENNILIQVALGKELSSNGHFAKAHEILSKIKPIIDKDFLQHRPAFYVNYVTNLVKNRMYKEALYVLEHEFSTDNVLFKYMLLQSRLLCYLYLRDTNNLSTYITYDLDAAPFPQNYMLKVIKSAYFYLIQEYDTALSIINSLLQARYASDIMKFYQPISVLYKKLYTISQKNALQKKWTEKDIHTLKTMITDFEKSCDLEIRMVSIYTWLKQEIEHNLTLI